MAAGEGEGREVEKESRAVTVPFRVRGAHGNFRAGPTRTDWGFASWWPLAR